MNKDEILGVSKGICWAMNIEDFQVQQTPEFSILNGNLLVEYDYFLEKIKDWEEGDYIKYHKKTNVLFLDLIPEKHLMKNIYDFVEESLVNQQEAEKEYELNN